MAISTASSIPVKTVLAAAVSPSPNPTRVAKILKVLAEIGGEAEASAVQVVALMSLSNFHQILSVILIAILEINKVLLYIL